MNASALRPLRASTIISSLTGYPRHLWAGKLLIMLQAFVDDSKSDFGQRRYYLAGYLQHADIWEGFIEDWDRKLKRAPTIQHLHAVDAQGLCGEFAGWNPDDRNRKLISLASVIKNSSLQSFEVSLSLDDFEEVFVPYAPWNVRHPYFTCFYTLIIKLAQFHRDANLEAPLSFIFDDQGGTGENAVRWFNFIRDINPTLKDILKSPPRFEDDVKVVPLQAADMLAWHLRRESESRQSDDLPALPFLRSETHFVYEVDRASLAKMGREMAATRGSELVRERKTWKSVRKEVRALLKARSSCTKAKASKSDPPTQAERGS